MAASEETPAWRHASDPIPGLRHRQAPNHDEVACTHVEYREYVADPVPRSGESERAPRRAGGESETWDSV